MQRYNFFLNCQAKKRKNLSLFFIFSGTIDPVARDGDRPWIPLGSVTVEVAFLVAFLLGSFRGSRLLPGHCLDMDPSGIDRAWRFSGCPCRLLLSILMFELVIMEGSRWDRSSGPKVHFASVLCRNGKDKARWYGIQRASNEYE